jgi:ATP-dependent Lhr-like helicase
MSHEAFSLLAEPIQKILWQMKWTQLRPIQVQAIYKVLQENNDLIISAKTAGGKTEAAFLPVLSKISEEPGSSVRALYVGPLKALINDQFRRLEDLCQYAEIPVHRWHGDISQDRKNKLLDKPSGVLLITPESIESLFVNHSSYLTRLFNELSFVVIDELHAFIGRERGTHLRSLLNRLNRYVQRDYRTLALSATLGNIEQCKKWLICRKTRTVDLIQDEAEQKRILYRIYGYLFSDDDNSEETNPTNEKILGDPVSDMYDAFAGSKNLIFANRKDQVETFADLLNERCRTEGRPAEFLVHHGSLSKQIREQTEELMRGSRPMTTLCSSTMELGIDIGDTKAVGQIDSPWSVNSLIQRLGRSGRKSDQPSIMQVFIAEEEPPKNAIITQRLHLEILQAIAMTELMLEKWLEPSETQELDFSTFIQQVLSVLAETGGISAQNLYDRLIISGSFPHITQDLFVQILRCIAGHDLIEQMPEGDLILGVKGQKVVSHYDFYSAFASSEEYDVIHDAHPIGSIPVLSLPLPKDHILLAARRWEVLDVDHDRKVIVVKPAQGRKPPKFVGRGGDIHHRIRQKMRDILVGNKPIQYLNENAEHMLENARKTAMEAGLDNHDFFCPDSGSCFWFTWTGTRVQTTLCLLAELMGLEVIDREVALEFKYSVQLVKNNFSRIMNNLPSPLLLAQKLFPKERKKYDLYLSVDLLNYQLAETAIDLQETKCIVQHMLVGE